MKSCCITVTTHHLLDVTKSKRRGFTKPHRQFVFTQVHREVYASAGRLPALPDSGRLHCQGALQEVVSAGLREGAQVDLEDQEE